MPIIHIDITPQSKEVKEAMITRLTGELSEMIEVPKKFFRVIINEVAPENLGIAGDSLSSLKEEGKIK